MQTTEMYCHEGYETRCYFKDPRREEPGAPIYVFEF